MQKYHTASIDRLFEVISKIETKEQCAAFLEDLCTIKELQGMAQRLDTAILLDEGHSFQKIANEIGTSTATISRVNRALLYGSGGYQAVIDKMTRKERENDD